MRLDKYLKVSRIIKRRTVANEAAGAGRVTVNGRQAKPSTDVKPGDTLDLLLGGRHVVVRVESVAEHTPQGRTPPPCTPCFRRAEAVRAVGILLCAGTSQRMGFDKLIEPLCGKSAIERSMDALRAGRGGGARVRRLARDARLCGGAAVPRAAPARAGAGRRAGRPSSPR